jgi:hypothetical protein
MGGQMNNPNALLYKWLVINSFAALLVYIAWLRDWIDLVVESDASYLSIVIGLVFVVFWLTSSFHILTINREIGLFASGAKTGVGANYFLRLRRKGANFDGVKIEQGLLASTLRARMFMPIQIVAYVANVLILLGLIGTVVGFVIAVNGLGDSIAGGTNIERVQGVLGQIVNGMGVALFTTLVGAVLGGLWLQIHYQMLMRAVGGLVVDIVERADIEIIPEIMRATDADAMTKAAAE